MNIEFTIEKPEDWVKQIDKQIGGQLQNNTLTYPPHLGEGFIKNFQLSKGLSISYVTFKLLKEIIFTRKSSKNSTLSPIVFYFDSKSSKQVIDNEIKDISSNSPSGIFWPSSDISSTWYFPIDEWVSHFTIFVNHKWLLDKCNLDRNNYVYKMISSGKSFCIFESITMPVYHILNDIADIINNNSHSSVSHLLLESKTTELLALFLEKLLGRRLYHQTFNLSSADIEKIFKARKLLLEDASKTPTLIDLANKIGFSESKLQKVFKQVFGNSIYQYALQEKMLLAKKMLRSKEFSVSEVGYKLGYSNMSHFSKVFHKQFGINPKKFISESVSF